MNFGTAPKAYLHTAVDALRRGGDWRSILDEFPIPVYTTDAEGAVIYCNDACADFAGRDPQLGSDRWCVTWKLYTLSGEPLPHEDCPMARALKEKRDVHDDIIIVERPDGRRVACRAYPTPHFDADGQIEGAVNLLVEVTQEQSEELLEQAARCRRLSRATTDARASEVLASMARGYAATAASLTAD